MMLMRESSMSWSSWQAVLVLCPVELEGEFSHPVGALADDQE